MEYTIKHSIREYYEVYKGSQLISTADTYLEAEEDIEEDRKEERRASCCGQYQ